MVSRDAPGEPPTWGGFSLIQVQLNRMRIIGHCREPTLFFLSAYALHSLHEERPNLVEKYTQFLEAQLAKHLALGQRFTRGADAALTADQLRALGYIQ